MIYLGADHGGFALKEHLKTVLKKNNLEYVDLGATVFDPEDDYPDYAFLVAKAVAQAPGERRGVLCCRSAAGVVIAANKVIGIRAVAPLSVEAAQHAREHNDANVIGLSGDWLNESQASAIMDKFLATPFSNEARHIRRLQKITQFEQQV
ncbi:MAG: RpiB/LacA/LacB family sugar-phosphate isomerase [Patescibacteria group bacterium]|jgi:ribose 5-phosphate isomerase B